jgi:ankyrin repeat protein
MSYIEFQYHPINLDRPAFRLARLRKGNQTDDIWLHLFDAYLDEIEDGGIPYESLSYAWGGTEKKAKIWVGGSMLGITENLYVALHHLRPQHTDRILWIDAICIDQSNSKERTHQVHHMSEIYRKADRVLVWLGQGNIETDALMDFLNTLPQTKAGVNEAVLGIYQKEAAICPGYSGALHDLLRRPWFRRIWILQEVANAKRAIVICGNRSVSTRCFVAAPSVMGIKTDSHTQAVLDVMPGHLRETSWWSERRDLHTLLVKFRESLASDQRDMVYALMGLVSDTSQFQHLQADYNKDILVVIRDIVFTLFFPQHHDISADYNLNWTWKEFSQNLENLSRETVLDAFRHQDTILSMFIGLEDIDVNWRDEQHRTLLSRAAGKGYNSIVKRLLNIGKEDINSKDEDGRTPLSWAAGNGQEAVVKLLLGTGKADAYLKDKSGRTTLSWAAGNGHTAVAELLLGHFYDNSRDLGGRTPLSWAAGNGHDHVVKLLLKMDQVGVDSKDHYGRTPLSWAAENGHNAVARLLLDTTKADINSEDRYGRTPLLWAAENGNNGIVRLLLERKDGRGLEKLFPSDTAIVS